MVVQHIINKGVPVFPKSLKSILLASVLSLTALTPVKADVSADIAAGGLSGAIETLKAQNSDNRFALGMLETLRAVEVSLQERWRYGIGQNLRNMPLMRIRIEPNRAALPAAPDTFSNIVRQLLADLKVARADLEKASLNPAAAVNLRVGDLWFDVNADGERQPEEGAATLVAPLVLSRRQLREAKEALGGIGDIAIDFDAADVNWLLAYNHVLSGVGEVYLGFDPTPVLKDLAEKTAALKNVPERPYPMTKEDAQIRLDALLAQQKDLDAQMKQYRTLQSANQKRRSEIMREIKLAKTDVEKAALEKERAENADRSKELRAIDRQFRFDQNDIRTRIADIYAQSPLQKGKSSRARDKSTRQMVDLIYVLLESLRQTPDAGHIQQAHKHFLAMIAQNKLFWEKVGQETDNQNEWIPNEAQSSAIGIDLPKGAGAAWQAVLADAEKVLHGEYLVPHYYLPEGYGINLKKYVENPGPIDLLPSILGIGYYNYVEKGPRMSRGAWTSFNRLVNGRASTFAVFFN